MPDYRIYRLAKREVFITLLYGLCVCLIAGWLFFNSFIGLVLAPVYLPIHFKRYIAKKKKSRADELRIEFKDAVNCLTAALETGYSVENAIKETVKELELLYDENAVIIIEFKEIIRKLKNNINVESALWDFATRSHIDDIIYFVEVFITANRTGGNILQILRTTRNSICDKIELDRELRVMISAKLYEVKIMKVIPLCILFYLKVFNFDMIEPLYTGLTGSLIMLVLLMGYFGLCCLSDRITNIQT